ncbi:hypothetical protein OSB04_011783 [Centaurea solstitialis]|uniref:Reverse transcriptase Ty1/copia-type domain-containing protein n=1 Tax=Centaurea solstitialis TaxID=347529 RepID=A0AA38TBU7_9ASTR|nr:hypothetical protein OSB04_011783 [Centaurea solstitialis]
MWDCITTHTSVYTTDEWCVRKEESYITRYGTIDDVSLYTTSVILGTCARNSSTYTEQSANKVGGKDAIRVVEGKVSQFREPREDVDLQVVDEENTTPIVEPEIQHENVEPQSEPIEEVQTQDLRRSNRVRQEPDRYLGFLVSQVGGDLNEPTSYGEVVSGSESEQWQEAMKVEMQSMYDNQVWELTDLPQHCRAVGRKWVFKKKTDMDENVHTFKARLVAKGFTQTHGICDNCQFLTFRIMPPRREDPELTRLVSEQVLASLPNIVSQVAAGLNTNQGADIARNRECTYKSFRSCNPKEFHGTEGAVGLLTWIEGMESVLHISKCTERNKVEYAACLLQGRALTWWNTQVQTRGREATGQISWEDFKQMLKEEFCPRSEI